MRSNLHAIHEKLALGTRGSPAGRAAVIFAQTIADEEYYVERANRPLIAGEQAGFAFGACPE